MAGASTIQFNDVRSILRSLVITFHSYEAQRQFEIGSYGIVSEDLPESYSLISPLTPLSLDLYLRHAKSARVIHSGTFDTHHSQRVLGNVIYKNLSYLENCNYNLQAPHLREHVLVLWAVRIACTMYRETGRRDKAISLLETVLHLVEPDVDLERVEIWYYYNKMLIELAHCCAEDGHQDEARDLLENKIKFPSNLRCTSHFAKTIVRLFRCMLRKSREDALQVVGELENDRSGTCFRQEHHARLQEGSSEPEAVEWGPFLTDCMEWDKI